MFYVLLTLYAIPSPPLFFINSEAAAVAIGLMGSRPWVAVAACLALGQSICYALLYRGGERLWQWGPVARRLKRWRGVLERRENKKRGANQGSQISDETNLQGRSPSRGLKIEPSRRRMLVLIVAASVGLPPFILVSTVVSRWGVSLGRFFCISFVCRFARFSVFAGLPSIFRPYVSVESLPSWFQYIVGG